MPRKRSTSIIQGPKKMPFNNSFFESYLRFLFWKTSTNQYYSILKGVYSFEVVFSLLSTGKTFSGKNLREQKASLWTWVTSWIIRCFSKTSNRDDGITVEGLEAKMGETSSGNGEKLSFCLKMGMLRSIPSAAGAI